MAIQLWRVQQANTNHDGDTKPAVWDLVATLIFLGLVSYPSALSVFVSDSSRDGHADIDVTVAGWCGIGCLLAALVISARNRRGRRARPRARVAR